jgi:RNA polymerase-binding transcription factor DksA
MIKTEVDRFRDILTARVAELERVTGHRDAIMVERSADQLEEIQAASQRALAVSKLDREFNQLRDARAALRRIQEGSFGTCKRKAKNIMKLTSSPCIEEGSFGTCQEREEDIHPKRLAAVPWAAFRIQCQEAADRNLEEFQAPGRDFLDRAA